ncbi:MAG TPA: GC-type dockerin domain-anchored protein [Phycisphaerales bacterium]|nr:GC-type dockerin domain-anchored protein [Phycisphaerales bacterium]
MKNAAYAAIAALVLSAGGASAIDAHGSVPSSKVQPRVQAAVDNFVRTHDGARIYWTGGQVTSIYGAAFSGGLTADESVENFLKRNLDTLGLTRSQIMPGSLAADGAAVREIMPDLETGQMKFQLHTFLQNVDGIPVHNSQIKLLVRNEPGYPLVLVRSGARNLGQFRMDVEALNNPNLEAAFAAASARVVGITDWGTPELTIWPGDVENGVPAALALKFIVKAGEPWEPGYRRLLMIADARTGAILATENQVHDVDVSGNVSAMSTEGKKADQCANEVMMPMPYARVAIGATVAYADVNGNFTIPNGGSSAVTVTAGTRGRWFRVYNPSVDAPTLSQSVTPPGPANFVFNSDNLTAARRAEANAYIHANIVRDFLLTYAPTFPTIPGQTEFRVNTGVSGTCNAFYDGTSINFYNAGGGCANTAFSDVVHHEYGHHIVQVAGSGQGQYGEGYGDLMGILISDEPVLGYGFQNNCAAGIRSANNLRTYPCTAEIHDCGQMISGAFWATRNELVADSVSNYRDLLAAWACNSVLLHDGTEITPQVTIDVLTLDDNNANISDGTPHYFQIADGFGSRNLDAPPLSLLAFNYPGGRPANVSPFGGEAFTVQVSALAGTPQPNTGVLMVDAENDGSYVAYPMSQISSNNYSAVFPATICGNTIRYYVTAKTSSNITVSDPVGAPGTFHTAISAAAVSTPFSDNFQTATGWTATVSGATAGQWQRAVPTGGGDRGDPAADYDGSGFCYLTQNGAGDTDVDGGSVILTSPVLNASGGEAYVSYARWYSNNFGADPNNDTFLVQISNNNGSTWTTLETVGPVNESNGGWYHKTFKISSFVAPTASMRLRFTASDLGSGSVVEAGVDAVKITVVTDCGQCPSDFDGSGFVDIEDFNAFVAAFEAGVDEADFDGSGFVDIEDYSDFVEAFESGC